MTQFTAFAANIAALVAAKTFDPKALHSVRAPKLEIGGHYVLTAWTGKEKTAQAVEFLGSGAAVDDLAEKNPRIKDLAEGQFYFFNTVDAETNEVRQLAAFGHDGMLCIGVDHTKDDVTTSVPTRVTFFSETAAVKAAPAPKAPKVKKEKAAKPAKAEAAPQEAEQVQEAEPAAEAEVTTEA